MSVSFRKIVRSVAADVFLRNLFDWLVWVFSPLLLAIWLYSRFRETGLLIGFRMLSINEVPSTPLPGFIVDNLPDGLWVFAFTVATGLIWKGESFSRGRLWLLSVPFVGLLSELGQGLGQLTGTFDWKDLVAYVLGTGLATILIFFKFFKTNLVSL